MKPNLEKEMKDIVQGLKESKKINLAKQIEENWDKTCLEYSKELNSWKPERAMEPELIEAFDKELERLCTPNDQKEKILASLSEQRILQTTPHVTAIGGPRMLCIDWLATLGIKKGDFYVVAMFSGIPFSNSFHPGRITMKDSSVNLFPSTMQDDLVYQSTIQEKLIESIKDIPSQMNKLLPKAVIGESYTKWALKAYQNIERKILEKDNLIFLDINEVISNYLIKVLKNKDHVFHKIFFDHHTRNKFMEAFPGELMFYCSITDGKYKKMENIIFSGNSLKSKHKEIPLNDPEVLIAELQHGRLCPALAISFLALAFINQFKCFGSFAQVEYLPLYQKRLAKLEFMEEFEVEKVPTSSFTYGTFPEGEIFPTDLVSRGEVLKQESNLLFGDILYRVKERLTSNNFRGHEKTNGNT